MEVGVEDFQNLFMGGFLDRSGYAYPCIVDQHIDSTFFGNHIGHCLFNAFHILHIQLDQGKGFKIGVVFKISGGAVNLASLVGQKSADGFANSGRTSGNEYHFAFHDR